MEWLHSLASEHGVPYLSNVVLELRRSNPRGLMEAVARLGPLIEHDLVLRRAVIEAFVRARANQPAEVTAQADEVLAEVGQQIAGLWEQLERS